ncbi:transketolase [Bradyrhizobium sp. PRIMUS42]|uniref:transketolase n=1 Tax=Bradyrhizobium sp. PRIMUS42 TaxID=2908926 RepID=UPI001FF0E913|nr:transketolase [Bradyrhizobium sp. PRIMUS42]MCJ9728607.1 transketolase [Bradyrhizobium sp. PRIMUS42]
MNVVARTQVLADSTLNKKMADAIRLLSLDAIERAGDGHPGAPLGCAEIATVLFTRHLKLNPADPNWFDRDRFVLSNGHGSMLLYSLLYLSGYQAVTIEQIKSFRKLGSICHGHPEYATEYGIEVTTGPLGQGFANGVGMAVAEEHLRNVLGPGVVDHFTYVLAGDGCLMEGVAQEALSLAGHLKLGKLIVLWDDNSITDDGSTSISISEDIRTRFRAAGWQVLDADGHDTEAIDGAIAHAKSDSRPSLIACATTIGRGFVRLEGQRGAHGSRVFKEDTEAARERLGWTFPPFVVPDDVLAGWRGMVDARNGEEYRAWQARLAELPADKRALVERLARRELPTGWEESLGRYKRSAIDLPAQPSIQSSGEAVASVFAAIPELMSGAPDLEGPTGHKRELRAFTASDRGGRFVHYGIREHAMGSMMNGMAAHGGIIPIGATYLAFSDYLRPAIRMAALMGVPTVFVFSHDSIGIGQNGPTHQPVEIVASLRAIPNMLVMRPADAVEVAECWEMALARRDGPSSLILSRQPLPPVRNVHTDENLCARGAYVLAEAVDGPRKVSLIATGSEVSIALEAKRLLEKEGISTAVVSMPSWEAFERQDERYRRSTLGGEDALKVGIEAAVRQGWERYLGENGIFVGMTGFGASGPGEELFRHFGITAENVVGEVKRRLRIR